MKVRIPTLSRPVLVSIVFHAAVVVIAWGGFLLGALDDAPEACVQVQLAVVTEVMESEPPARSAPPPEAPAEPVPATCPDDPPPEDSEPEELFILTAPATVHEIVLAVPAEPCLRWCPPVPKPPVSRTPAPVAVVKSAPHAAPAAAPSRRACPTPGSRAPRYPLRARENGWEGRVVLLVAVASDGEPTRVDVLAGSGYRELDVAAVRAVERWRFRPALRRGRPIAAEIEVPIRFALR